MKEGGDHPRRFHAVKPWNVGARSSGWVAASADDVGCVDAEWTLPVIMVVVVLPRTPPTTHRSSSAAKPTHGPRTIGGSFAADGPWLTLVATAFSPNRTLSLFCTPETSSRNPRANAMAPHFAHDFCGPLGPVVMARSAVTSAS